MSDCEGAPGIGRPLFGQTLRKRDHAACSRGVPPAFPLAQPSSPCVCASSTASDKRLDQIEITAGDATIRFLQKSLEGSRA
jgi:hypothetical protein